ncbi:hypothetical protein CRYUN_Cryun31cG0001800 [Craigia yunnanensis]
MEIFLIDLPSHLHGIPNLQKICAVKVLRIPSNSMCPPTSFRQETLWTKIFISWEWHPQLYSRKDKVPAYNI